MNPAQLLSYGTRIVAQSEFALFLAFLLLAVTALSQAAQKVNIRGPQQEFDPASRLARYLGSPPTKRWH